MSNTITGGKILEGVFAINKPPSMSSAQVLRNLQTHFDPSAIFAPWLAEERATRRAESKNQKNRRSHAKRGPVSVKMGHGGTLDPLATGVLIAGVGKGTKALQQFLECTKAYECVVLFGAATDTYDSEGKVIGRKPYSHITREGVEEALGAFRGKIMQKPPAYSALRIDGKRFYEYAREGKEIPVEIKARPVEVVNVEMTEWLPGGSHEFNWPDKEAGLEEKAVAKKLLNLGDNKGEEPQVSDGQKRKREMEEDAEGPVRDASPATKKQRDEEDTNLMSGALVPGVASSASTTPVPQTGVMEKNDATEQANQPQLKPQPPATAQVDQPEPQAQPPAARIRMTVTSGFYVRSLCHDLGAAVGSLGFMASLVRTRQGDFELGKNVLEYDDLVKGEDVWGPQVERMLEAWNEKQS